MTPAYSPRLPTLTPWLPQHSRLDTKMLVALGLKLSRQGVEEISSDQAVHSFAQISCSPDAVVAGVVVDVVDDDLVGSARKETGERDGDEEGTTQRTGRCQRRPFPCYSLGLERGCLSGCSTRSVVSDATTRARDRRRDARDHWKGARRRNKRIGHL